MIRNLSTLLLISFITFFRFQTSGQKLEVEFSKVTEIKERMISNIDQDITGYIWISSNNTIYKNSNQEYKKYSSKDLLLKPNHISTKLVSDANGNIWYYPNNDFKIRILNTKKEEASSLAELFPALPFSESDIIKKIYRDELYNIYISVRNKGLYKFDGKKITLVKLFKENNKYPIFYVHTKTNNWFAFGNRIIKQHKVTLAEKTFFVDKKIIGANIIDDEAIFFEKINFNSFIVKSIKDDKVVTVFPNLKLDHNYIYDDRVFQKKENDTYWINEKDNLIQFDEKKNIILKINKGSLPFKNRYAKFFVDNNNTIWMVGEIELYKVTILKNNFKKYLQGFSLKSIFKRDSTIYVSNFGGGFKTLNSKQEIQQFKYLNDKHSFYGSVYQKDTLWITNGNSVRNFNFKKKKETIYSKSKEIETKSISFEVIARHPKTKNIFIGSPNNLYKINKEKKEVYNVKLLDSFVAKKDRDKLNIRTLQVDGDSLWIGSSKGLFLMNHEEKITRALTPKNGLPDNLMIQFVFVENKTTIWLGTKGQGLIKWDRLKNNFKTYTTKDGLSNNNIYAIFKDEFGFFWLPTDNGLNRFAPKTLINQIFLPNEISDREFNHLSHFKDKDGTLYLGGLSGLNIFHPKDFLNNYTTAYNLVLKNIKTTLQDNTIINKSNISKNTITINAETKSKELEFLLLDFKNRPPLQYQYKISPLHKNFIVTKSNKITLPKLDNGKYLLQVKAQSSDGTWSELEEQINIDVSVSIIYRLIYPIIFLLALISFFVIKKRKKKKEVFRKELDIKKSLTDTVDVVLETKQDEWLQHLKQTIIKNMNSISFGMEFLSQEMDLSERQLQRRIKSLTNLTPNKYITEVRLNEAFRLIQDKEIISVKELSKKVGFSTPDYFSKLFKQKYGKKPSDLLNF